MSIFDKNKNKARVQKYGDSEGTSGPQEQTYEVPEGLDQNNAAEDFDDAAAAGLNKGYNSPADNKLDDDPVPQPPVFAEGQSAPEDEAGFHQKKRTPAQKKNLMFAGGALLVMAIVIAINFIGPAILQRSRAVKGYVDTQDQKLMAMTEDYKKVKEQLTLQKQQNDEMLNQIPQIVENQLRESLKNINVSNDNEALNNQISEMKAEQEDLKAQIAAAKTTVQEPVQQEVTPPREASGGASTIFTTLAARKEAKKAEEDAAQKKADDTVAPYDVRAGVPTGIMVPAMLKTMLFSSTKTDKFQAIAETTAPFEFLPGYVLPAGVRFIGKATPDFDSRRMIVDVTKLQYGAAEVNMKGVMTDYRGNPGMVTKYQDPLMQGIPIIAFTSLLSAAASAAQDMTTKTNYNGDSYETPEFNGKNVALQGASNTMNNVSSILTQHYAQKQPVIQVKNNYKVMIQFSEKLPLETLVEAGVVTMKR